MIDANDGRGFRLGVVFCSAGRGESAGQERNELDVRDHDTDGLSPDQKRAIERIAGSPWLVQPLWRRPGPAKTTSMRALVAAAHHSRRRVLVLAPTGKAVGEGAGDTGYTVAKALESLRDENTALRLTLRRPRSIDARRGG